MKQAVVGMLVALALLPAGTVRAEGTPWGQYQLCAPGATAPGFYACASATVSFEPTAGGGVIVVTVRNTGLYHDGAQVLDWGYGLTGIGITAPAAAGVALESVTGTNPSGTSPGEAWEFARRFNGLDVSAGAHIKGVDRGAIWGCEGAPGGVSYFRTCDAADQVVFRFSTTTPGLAPGDPGVQLVLRGQAGYQGDSYRCSDLPGETSASACRDEHDSTVPEPLSLVLLGSGLLGLAGARNRRRRR